MALPRQRRRRWPAPPPRGPDRARRPPPSRSRNRRMFSSPIWTRAMSRPRGHQWVIVAPGAPECRGAARFAALPPCRRAIAVRRTAMSGWPMSGVQVEESVATGPRPRTEPAPRVPPGGRSLAGCGGRRASPPPAFPPRAAHDPVRATRLHRPRQVVVQANHARGRIGKESSKDRPKMHISGMIDLELPRFDQSVVRRGAGRGDRARTPIAVATDGASGRRRGGLCDCGRPVRAASRTRPRGTSMFAATRNVAVSERFLRQVIGPTPTLQGVRTSMASAQVFCRDAEGRGRDSLLVCLGDAVRYNETYTRMAFRFVSRGDSVTAWLSAQR